MLADNEDQGIHIVTKIVPGIWANVDETFYIRMMVNLLSNAVRYSAENGKRRGKAGKKHGEVVGSVRDHGEGISADVLPHIWERFYRADSSRTDSSHSGLGLSMVRWIAEAHGGRVFSGKRSGKGKRIYVLFSGRREQR